MNQFLNQTNNLILKKDIRMANIYMKRYTTVLVIREIHVNP